MPTTIIPTQRPLHQRLLDLAREHFGMRRSSLRELDSRALADIGSEIASIEAESQGRAHLTRRRILGTMHHV